MNEFNAKIAEIGIVPVIKLNNPERDAGALAKALCDGGVPVAEVTFRAEGADKAIRIMRKESHAAKRAFPLSSLLSKSPISMQKDVWTVASTCM